MSRKRTSSDKQAVRSHGLLVATLVLIGLFASFLVYIKTQSGAPSGEPGQVAAVDREPARGTSRQPKYDFYTDLPQREVVIPPPAQPEPRRVEPPREAAPQPPREAAPAEPPRQAETPREPQQQQQAAAASPGYLVQAGAFNLYSQADRVRAQLGMMGIQARIEEGVREGLPIYRVRIGPVSSAEADSLSRRLSDNNISSLKLQAN